ncbi:MAG: S53 family serine peptidase [Actinomycetota bacterium]|nr:S53 family serine peptidase [Actinomycetota bacterium]
MQHVVGFKYVGNAVRRIAARPLFAVASLACALGFASAAPASAATGSPSLIAHATRVGAAPTGQSLKLLLPLKVDSAGLARFAAAVATPGSPLYGQYLSVAQLARRFGASRSGRRRAVGYLRASGATHVRVDATGLLAEATMSVGLAERVFSAPLAQFRAADRTRFLAPASATRVPAPLRDVVEGVVGLDTAPRASHSLASATAAAARSAAARSAAASARAADSPGSTLPRSGSPTGCPEGVAAGGQYPGFTPNQYLTAYGFMPLYLAGYRGQGERVALIEIDGFNMSDVTAFAACFGLTVPPISAFGSGLSNPLPPGEEATLDLEILDAAAPNLKAIDVYETDSGAVQTLAAFAAPLQNRGHKPQVISASLGLCEPDAYGGARLVGIEASERLLELAAASGVSILASGGDNGSADCQTSAGTPAAALAVNYPASSWWVTGVGGTNLSLTPGNTIAAQPVWNDAALLPAGGGGGFSDLFRRPSYQKGIVSVNKRAVPDVSMLADLLPGYAIYCTATPDCNSSQNPSPPWQTVGGTSAGTPLLAGGVAIIDQMLKATHHENLGLLNPLLYKVGHSLAAATVFSDVTSGSNDIGPFLAGGQALGCCTAAPGFDEASGWGSVSVAGLAQQALALVPKNISFSLALPQHQRPVAHRAIMATVSCSAGCSIGAFAAINVGRAKPYTVSSKLLHPRSKGRKTVAIKFSGKELRSLRSALSHHKRIVATVYAALIDQLGGIEHNTRGMKLSVTS